MHFLFRNDRKIFTVSHKYVQFFSVSLHEDEVEYLNYLLEIIASLLEINMFTEEFEGQSFV